MRGYLSQSLCHLHLKAKYHVWMLLLVLILGLLPGSLQLSERQKRQVRFPAPEHGGRGNGATSCVTADRRPGLCVSLRDCPMISQIDNINRLWRFFCGFDGDDPRVCCPQSLIPDEDEDFETIPTTTTTQSPRIPMGPTPPPDDRGQVSGTMPEFLPKICGISKYPLRKVVGGREAKKGMWPWMAVLYRERRGARSPICGGTLVTNQHVVTAAHCVVGQRRPVPFSPNELSVRLGEHDIFSNDDGMKPVNVGVTTSTVHEDYIPSTYANDIAVLKLVRPVQFNANISAICLPFDFIPNQDLTGRKAFVAGWGTTVYNGSSSPVLREASFEITDQNQCRDAYRNNDIDITDIYLCAGTLDGTKDTCQGDSGGPLMGIGNEKRFYLVGVVSFGNECAVPGYPGVYTRVTKYLDWLQTFLTL